MTPTGFEHWRAVREERMRAVGLNLLAPLLHGERGGIPVTLCSGHSEYVDPERLAAAGVALYLEKPIDPPALLAGLRSVLDARPGKDRP